MSLKLRFPFQILREAFKVSLAFKLVNLLLILISLVQSDHVYRSYQKTIYCNASSEIQFPKDTTSLIVIVQNTIARGQKVKAIGSRHSISDIICTEGIPISLENIAHARINPDTTATFGAGIKLRAAMEFLESKNLSLIHIPTFGGISLAGALGTGAHGSSLRHAATLSDQVVRLTVATGNGNVLRISGPELDIYRVHLGLLGILIDVTLQTVPLFKMTVKNEVEGDSLLFDGSIPLAASSHDMYQLWWFPHTKRVVIGTGEYISTEIPGCAVSNLNPALPKSQISLLSKTYELLNRVRSSTQALNILSSLTELSLYAKVAGIPFLYTENGTSVNPATGYGWRLQSDTCENAGSSACPWDGNGDDSFYVEESAIVFDISKFTGVMKMIQGVLKQHPAAFPLNGIFIRFIKSSPASMAISSQRNTFVVEWATAKRKNPFETGRNYSIGTYQAIMQEMVTNYGGWTHWGKSGLYYTSKEILARNPNRRQFIAAMKKYDPQGTFLNAFGRRMLGISNAQDRDPRVKHCALQDYCICSSNNDCAPVQRCDQINGFNVCLDNFNLTASIARDVDNAIPDLYNLPRNIHNIILQIKNSL